MAMETEQNITKEQILLAKQKKQKIRRYRLFIRLFTCCLIIGVVCFPIAKVVMGLINADINKIFPSETQDIFAPNQDQTNETFKGYIALDPGHGGEDSPGCVYEEVLERDVALELSLLIRDELVQEGYKVLMTREKDEQVTLDERTQIANDSDADLFISIHLNAFEDALVSGIETWFNPDTNTRSSSLAEYIQKSITKSTKGKDRGTLSNTSLIVIREVLMPSCLIEVGFLSNDEERRKLSTQEYREKVAEGIIEGIEQYFKKTSSRLK